MKRKKSLLMAPLMIFLLLTGCVTPAFQTAVMPKPDDSILEAFQPSISDLNNRFGFDLYHALEDGTQNTLISPASVAMALAMTYNGADAETKEAMASVLHVEGIDLDTLNKNNLALLYFLKTADPKVRLEIANSIWLLEGMDFDPDFLQRNEDFYLAGAAELNFADPAAAGIMNAWVKENTQGLIEDIIEPPIDDDTIMFLINAVYFQGTWTEQFDKEATRDDVFYPATGASFNVPMMSQSGSYEYLETPEFQAVRLPYGKDKRMAMYVFLPQEEKDLAAFRAGLGYDQWQTWLGNFTETEGYVELPRFTVEYEETLNDVLKNLGMEIAFDAKRANFYKMVPGIPLLNIFIGEVKHKAFIQVDEVGTEAAAVTSVEMKVESAPMDTFSMRVNRPFFYAIQDSVTGSILFMGSVLDPRS
jgi:serine protease inhibitor